MRLLNQTLGLLRNHAQNTVCVRSLVALTDDQSANRAPLTLLSRVKSLLTRVAIPSVCLVLALTGVYAQCNNADVDGNRIVDDSDLLQVLFCFGQRVDGMDLEPCKEQLIHAIENHPSIREMGMRPDPQTISATEKAIWVGLSPTTGEQQIVAYFVNFPEGASIGNADGTLHIDPGSYVFSPDRERGGLTITNISTGRTYYSNPMSPSDSARKLCSCGDCYNDYVHSGGPGQHVFEYCLKCKDGKCQWLYAKVTLEVSL